MSEPKRKPRGKTERFILDEEFIFGGIRCMRCGKVMKDGDTLNMICKKCKGESLFK